MRAEDLNGCSVPGALAYFYDSGTSRARTVYADPECATPHPSPLAANGAGVFPAVYVSGGSDVKVDVRTPDGVSLAGYPMDPARVVSTDATGAAGVSFAPTEEIPATNVQAAIEQVFAAIVTPLLDFGLGVTGNAPLIANLDVTSTASGFYRFDGTTAGTAPAGVSKADGGVVLIFRRNASSGVMFLIANGSNRVHYRRLATSWQAWAWLANGGDTASNSLWQAGASTVPVLASPANVMAAVTAKAIGEGQTWQAPARVAGTTYTNTTGRPIMVIVDANDSGLQFEVANPGGGFFALTQTFNFNKTFTAIIPPDGRYRVVGGNFTLWRELR